MNEAFKFCPECGTENTDGRPHCSNCGFGGTRDDAVPEDSARQEPVPTDALEENGDDETGESEFEQIDTFDEQGNLVSSRMKKKASTEPIVDEFGQVVGESQEVNSSKSGGLSTFTRVVLVIVLWIFTGGIGLVITFLVLGVVWLIRSLSNSKRDKG